jgi:hypothetical protein
VGGKGKVTRVEMQGVQTAAQEDSYSCWCCYRWAGCNRTGPGRGLFPPGAPGCPAPAGPPPPPPPPASLLLPTTPTLYSRKPENSAVQERSRNSMKILRVSPVIFSAASYG